eukprot:m.244598 g.244598  ORF g.244598 m.244598 type:complete len:72 (-) comp17149_c1_seq5:13560-13775(-)
MAGELHGCLELNDNGCITTFQILLSHGQLAEAAAEALLVVATHTPDVWAKLNGFGWLTCDGGCGGGGFGCP